MKKVLIIGAGAQGNVISGVLSKAHDIGEIMLADIDIERAEEVAQYVGSEKIKTATLNAADKSDIVNLLNTGPYDLVINATLMTFNRQIIKAALESGTHYLDMASNEFFTKKEGREYLVEQLEYADAFKEAGLTANILAGCDAGLVNILAKEVAEELDEVDYIGIKDYGVVACDEPVAMWSFQTYLEDCADEAIYWENGEYKYAPLFSGEEDYYFPEPLKRTAKVYYHNHEEPVTLPKFLGKPVKYVDFKMGDPDSATWQFLIEGLHLMDDTPQEINGCMVSPKDVFCRQLPTTLSPKKCIQLLKENRIKSQAVIAVDVKGKKNNKTLHYKMWTESPDIAKACSIIPGTNDVSWLTSVPASILSLMILRGQITRTGVFPCEVLNKKEREIFFKGIKEWDITIHKQVSMDIA
jgi:saccharopine dehydrogenase (NAD+, L-lysine-forming)